MFILDTNVLSVFLQNDPDPKVVSWFNQQPSALIWTTTITVFEIRNGIELLAHGRKRKELESVFDQILRKGLESRILPFDIAAAEYTAILAAKRYKTGSNQDFRDTAIAGIAISRHAKVVTRNTRHFTDLDIELINPWKTRV